MPFKTLSNETATNVELAEAYRGIDRMRTDLTAQRAEEYQQLVKLQQDALGGSGTAAQLKKGKEALSDVDLKIDACQSAMDEIRARMIQQAPEEIKAGIVAVNQIYDALMENKKKVLREFLDVVARAISIRARIEGEQFFYAQSSGEHLPIRYPGIEFSPTELKGDDLDYYHQACDSYHGSDECFAVRGNRLMNQKDKLESILTSGDFDNYVESLLAVAA